MNDKFKMLAFQATIGKAEFDNGSYYVATPDKMQKFAELIVKECAEICYHHSQAAGGVDTAFGYGYRDCGNDIKKHFGVEE